MRTSRLLAAAAVLVGCALITAAAAQNDGQDDLEKDIDELARAQRQLGATQVEDMTMEQLEERLRAQSEPSKPAELEAQAKKILQQVSVLRELPVKHPVALEVATREQIVAYVDSRIKETMKDEDLAGQEAALKRLGLLPLDMDMRQFLLDLYGEQVAGYYDPFKQKFFIASWMDSVSQTPIMAHELTHALQDQHYDLKPVLTPIADNSDATGARQAVVEGDAVVSMYAFLNGSSSISTQGIGERFRSAQASQAYPVFSRAPPYYQEAIIFPYADGTEFVSRMKGTGGFKPVAAIYKDFPRSSEQILHPLKFTTRRDDPTPVAMPLKLDGWTQVHNDVLGELVVRVMMAGFLDVDRAQTIAEGWDGDRYRAFQKKKGSGYAGTMIVLRTVWDTPDDAIEFFEGYVAIVPEKYDGATRRASAAAKPKVEDTFASFVHTSGTGTTVVHVERRGTEVLVIDGAPDEDTAAAVRKKAWGSP